MVVDWGACSLWSLGHWGREGTDTTAVLPTAPQPWHLAPPQVPGDQLLLVHLEGEVTSQDQRKLTKLSSFLL